MRLAGGGATRGPRPRTRPGADAILRLELDLVETAFGDPVGSPAWRQTAPAVFAGHCDRQGLVPAWFSVGAETTGPARAVSARRERR